MVDEPFPEFVESQHRRLELAEQEREEIEVIKSFLPAQMSDAEIEAITSAFTNDLSARLWALASAQRDLELRRSELAMRRQFLEEERRRLVAGVGLPASLMLAEDDLIESDIRVLEAVVVVVTVVPVA